MGSEASDMEPEVFEIPPPTSQSGGGLEGKQVSFLFDHLFFFVYLYPPSSVWLLVFQ